MSSVDSLEHGEFVHCRDKYNMPMTERKGNYDCSNQKYNKEEIMNEQTPSFVPFNNTDNLPEVLYVNNVKLVITSSSQSVDFAHAKLSECEMCAFSFVAEERFDGSLCWFYAPLEEYERKKLHVEASVVSAALQESLQSSHNLAISDLLSSASSLLTPSGKSEAIETEKMNEFIETVAPLPTVYLRSGGTSTFRRYKAVQSNINKSHGSQVDEYTKNTEDDKTKNESTNLSSSASEELLYNGNTTTIEHENELMLSSQYTSSLEQEWKEESSTPSQIVETPLNNNVCKVLEYNSMNDINWEGNENYAPSSAFESCERSDASLPLRDSISSTVDRHRIGSWSRILAPIKDAYSYRSDSVDEEVDTSPISHFHNYNAADDDYDNKEDRSEKRKEELRDNNNNNNNNYDTTPTDTINRLSVHDNNYCNEIDASLRNNNCNDNDISFITKHSPVKSKSSSLIVANRCAYVVVPSTVNTNVDEVMQVEHKESCHNQEHTLLQPLSSEESQLEVQKEEEQLQQWEELEGQQKQCFVTVSTESDMQNLSFNEHNNISSSGENSNVDESYNCGNPVQRECTPQKLRRSFWTPRSSLASNEEGVEPRSIAAAVAAAANDDKDHDDDIVVVVDATNTNNIIHMMENQSI